MEASAPAPPGGTMEPRKKKRFMSTTEIQALLELLLDDNPRVREAVTERIGTLGLEGLDALRAAAGGPEPRLRVRARNLLYDLETRASLAALEEVLREETVDLERAVILLACAEDPELDGAAISESLMQLGNEFTTRVTPGQTLEQRAELLASYLADEEGFQGNVEDFDDPRNSYIDQVLERRVGLPISLSAIYMITARRAGLEAHGVGMPMHFLVALRDGEEQVLLDPFGGGRIMTREVCRALLAGFHHSFREDYLKPVSDRHMVRRMMANLVRAYHHRGDRGRLQRFYRLVNILQER